MPIAKKSKQNTAFVTREGLFKFNSAPFGFKNLPAVFIKLVKHIFQDLINVDFMQLYLDDIIIYAETPMLDA